MSLKSMPIKRYREKSVNDDGYFQWSLTYRVAQRFATKKLNGGRSVAVGIWHHEGDGRNPEVCQIATKL